MRDAMVIMVTVLNFKRFFALCLACSAPFLVAAATAATVVLAWNANSDSDIAGYRIYYGTASAPYKYLDVATPTAAIPSLENGVTYTLCRHCLQHGRSGERVFSAPVLHGWFFEGYPARNPRQYFQSHLCFKRVRTS